MRPPARLDAWAITLSLSIIAGTIAPPLATALVLASIVVCAGSLFWKGLVPPDWRPMAVLLPLFVAAGAGIAFVHATTPDPLADLAAVEPGEVIITGKIASPPTQVSYGYMADVRVDHLWYDRREILRGGGVEVFAGDLNLGVGDRVRVEGEISPPDSGGGFDYGRYLSTKRISALVNATYVRPMGGGEGWIGEIHRRTDAALGYGLRPDEAAIVRRMVLGDRSLIPEELDTAFQRSGITHVLAISGQHVAVLAAMIYFLLRALAVPVMVRSPVTLALIWLYIIVAGAPPSALRAGVVATLVLAAPIFNRQLSPINCTD
ncbi:MAG: ComEC family competence protein [Actinomycetota bacterium]|nr:ComEC family competence protein [Actinomycetota bacterium]